MLSAVSQQSSLDKKLTCEAIFQHRMQMEKALAYVKIAIVLVMLLRLSAMELQPEVWYSGIYVSLAGLAWWGFLIWAVQAKRYRDCLSWVSMIVEYSLVFLGYLGNIIGHVEYYPGNLNLPDFAVLVLLLFFAGLRLSPAMLASAVMLTLLCVVALFYADSYVSHINYQPHIMSMWGIVLFFAGIVAGYLVYRIRAMIAVAVCESRRSAEFRRGVRSLLQSHHDAHSILSRLNFNFANLMNTVGNHPKLKNLANELLSDLDAVNHCVTSIKQGADASLIASKETELLSLKKPIQHFCRRYTAKPISADITLTLLPEELTVWVAGGENGLVRILQNLLTNALEGNGCRRASRVNISLSQYGKWGCLCVADNGPGFSDTVMKALESDPSSGYATSKGRGLGVGLQSVRAIVDTSGGYMQAGMSEDGGAFVRVFLLQSHCVTTT